MKRYLFLLFPFSLIAGIVIISCFRINDFNIINIAAVILYILWIMYEIFISKRDLNKAIHNTDYHTREIYAVSQGLTILSALYFYYNMTNSIVQIIGFVIFIPGIILRIWSIHTLGQYYSHSVRVLKKHIIINKGPYSLIRHPAYSGMLIIHTGIVLLYFNYVTMIILLLLLFPAIILRIHIEEKLLKKIPGYKTYASDKKRLIPLIW